MVLTKQGLKLVYSISSTSYKNRQQTVLCLTHYAIFVESHGT